MQIIKTLPRALGNAFLHKRSSLFHKDIEFHVHVCILIVCETVAGFIGVWDA